MCAASLSRSLSSKLDYFPVQPQQLFGVHVPVPAGTASRQTARGSALSRVSSLLLRTRICRRRFRGQGIEGNDLAARHDGRQKRFGFVGRQEEEVVRGRFLEQFEQAVGCLPAHGMHVFDQGDPQGGFKGREAEGFFQRADLINLDDSALRQDMEKIRVVVRGKLMQPLQVPHGADSTCLAAEKDGSHGPGGRGFAHPVRAGKEVGMGQPAALQGTAQKPDRLWLAEDICEDHG